MEYAEREDEFDIVKFLLAMNELGELTGPRKMRMYWQSEK